MSGQKITVRKGELLTILQQNRGKHRQVFEAAVEGYREQAMTWLMRTTDQVRAGRTPELSFGHYPPQDHTRDYDRVIRMVQMHAADTLDIDESVFASYVQDDWGWKRQFLDTSNTYAAATVTEVYGAETFD
jgi:hypothetical protein